MAKAKQSTSKPRSRKSVLRTQRLIENNNKVLKSYKND